MNEKPQLGNQQGVHDQEKERRKWQQLPPITMAKILTRWSQPKRAKKEGHDNEHQESWPGDQ